MFKNQLFRKKEKVQICSAYQFPRCQYSHHSLFQTTNEELGRKAHNWLSFSPFELLFLLVIQGGGGPGAQSLSRFSSSFCRCLMGVRQEDVASLSFFFFNFFSTFFIYFWDRARQSMNGGGAEREGDTESETGSRL